MTFSDSVDDQAMVKNLQALRSELETRLIEQVKLIAFKYIFILYAQEFRHNIDIRYQLFAFLG